ncbi:MAG: hypothetical protein ABW061_11800 [Polyangiaceae bacterium]
MITAALWLPRTFLATLLLYAACGSTSPVAPASNGGTPTNGGSANPGGAGAGAEAASGAPSAGSPSAGSGGGDPLPSAGADNAASGRAGTNTGGNFGGGGSAGQPSASVAFEAGRVTVTGVRGTASPVASAVIRLHNAGASTVQVKGLALSGSNQALFQLSDPPAFPVSLAAGAELPIAIALSTTGSGLPAAPSDKDTGCVLLTATLSATLDSGSVTASVYGLLLTRDNYEPTLGQILTTLGYSIDVGKAQDNWNSNQSMDAANLPKVEANSDEVAAQRFVKAGSGNVGLSLVARFSPLGALPYGWYASTTGCPSGCTTVGTMARISDAQTSDKARMVNPPPGTGSMSTFDPGSAPFGLWVYSDQKTQQFNEGGTAANGDWDYSEDALNAPANVHRFKSYPLKDAAGVSVPHTYLVAIEEAGNGDYQDYVFVLSNVTAAP